MLTTSKNVENNVVIVENHDENDVLTITVTASDFESKHLGVKTDESGILYITGQKNTVKKDSRTKVSRSFEFETSLAGYDPDTLVAQYDDGILTISVEVPYCGIFENEEIEILG
jgi:HSP20 family molecular chaperone IbpA